MEVAGSTQVRSGPWWRTASQRTLASRPDSAVSRRNSPSELALVVRAQRGGAREREALVEHFLPLIVSVAHAYRRSSKADREELTQEGVVGLLRALARFEPDRGVPFWGYAAWWVRQAMQQVVSELSRPMVLSDRALRQLARIKAAQQHFEQTRKRQASTRELAAIVALPQSQVERLLCTERSARGLDEPLGGEAGNRTTIGDLIAHPSAEDAFDRVPQQILAGQVPDLLAHLSDRERTVICSRYGLGQPEQTLLEVAPILGVSAERVRQIEQDSLVKLYAVACGHTRPADREPPPEPTVRPAQGAGEEAALLDQLLAPIEQRRRHARRRLDELARQRVTTRACKHPAENAALRAEAREITDQLARLNVVASVTTRLFQPRPTGAYAAHAAPAGASSRAPGNPPNAGCPRSDSQSERRPGRRG